jgi:hypothetical protein
VWQHSKLQSCKHLPGTNACIEKKRRDVSSLHLQSRKEGNPNESVKRLPPSHESMDHAEKRSAFDCTLPVSE